MPPRRRCGHFCRADNRLRNPTTNQYIHKPQHSWNTTLRIRERVANGAHRWRVDHHWPPAGRRKGGVHHVPGLWPACTAVGGRLGGGRPHPRAESGRKDDGRGRRIRLAHEGRTRLEGFRQARSLAGMGQMSCGGSGNRRPAPSPTSRNAGVRRTPVSPPGRAGQAHRWRPCRPRRVSCSVVTALPTGTVAFLMTDIEGSTRLVRDLGRPSRNCSPNISPSLARPWRPTAGPWSRARGTPSSRSFHRSVRRWRPRSPASGHLPRSRGRPAPRFMYGWGSTSARRCSAAATTRASTSTGRRTKSWRPATEARSSCPTAHALAGEEPTYRDLGSHHLRDMPDPEHLFQLVAPGLPTEFPPLRTVAAETPTKPPAPLTQFIGRGAELAATCPCCPKPAC